MPSRTTRVKVALVALLPSMVIFDQGGRVLGLTLALLGGALLWSVIWEDATRAARASGVDRSDD